MKNIFKQITKITGVALLASSVIFTSCNKGFEDVPVVTPTTTSNLTIAEVINADANYSLLKDQLIRTGLINLLANKNGTYTLFALDNAAFAVANPALTNTPTVNAVFRVGQMDTLLRYHIVNTIINATAYPTTYPNTQMPTNFGTTVSPLVKFPVYLNKNTNGVWVNNIPVTGPNAVVAQNGVMHKIYAPIQPNGVPLINQINTDPNLTYFAAAIARADSGQLASPSAYTNLLGIANPLVSVTVMAPNDAAFKTLLFGLVYQGISQTAYNTVYTATYNAQITGGATVAVATAAATAAATAYVANPTNIATFTAQATALTATPAFFSNPAFFAALPAATVKGIIAYHLLAPPPNGTTIFGDRVFSNNLPLTTTTKQTFVNSAVPVHPGLTIDRSTAAPRLLGLGNGGSYANFMTFDKNALNGVYHIIDRVLLPQ